jgi:hypothetical protein
MEVDGSLAEMAILVTSTGFRCLGMSSNADIMTGVAVDMVTSSRTSPLRQPGCAVLAAAADEVEVAGEGARHGRRS